MRKIWHNEAWEEYIDWQNKDKKTLLCATTAGVKTLET